MKSLQQLKSTKFSANARRSHRQIAIERLENRTLLAADLVPIVPGADLQAAKPQLDPASNEVFAAKPTTSASAIVFVGGWGSSMYQYAHNDPIADLRRDADSAAGGKLHTVPAAGAVDELFTADDTVQLYPDDVVVDGRIITGEGLEGDGGYGPADDSWSLPAVAVQDCEKTW